MPKPATEAPVRGVAVAVANDGAARVFGLSGGERLARQWARCGIAADALGAARAVVMRADWVYDEALVRALAAAGTELALVAPDGGAVAVNVLAAAADAAAAMLATRHAPALARTVSAAELAGSYNDALRKREPPLLLELTAGALPAIERRVFGGAYKGVTDLVTLYLWPRPAEAVTRWCALRGITPNQVTTASLVCVLAAMALFWFGHHASGLVLAWIMTFLDTVDGKLARVTLVSTKLGNVYDHGIDIVHPPFWWWAWIVGLPAAGLPLAHPDWVLAAVVGGYVLQRLEEGAFIAVFGIEMHVWQRFDSLFRLVTARRNPNLLLLTAAVFAGRPDLGIVAVAVWTVASLAIHALRIAQAALARRRAPIVSWLSAA